MLVLSRKKGESFYIGDDIAIVILEAENGKVKIGIEADKRYKVIRKEIVEDVINTNRKAVTNLDLDKIKSYFPKKST
jgi:carbon storage regulator